MMLCNKWMVVFVLTTVLRENLAEGGVGLMDNVPGEIFKYIRGGDIRMAERMRMKVYKGERIEFASVADIPITSVEAIYQQIDHTMPLVIYTHGFREHPSNTSIRTVVGAYLERGTDNIFLLDWSQLAFENYLIVKRRVSGVAEVLAKTFDALVDLGLNLETFHFVGHSLGAQIGGFFGKYTKYSIPRITGLDPANPGFYYTGAKHIDANSARFVDIIHTDGGFYGAREDTGTVDFYPNGGSRPQPGCNFLGVPVTPSDLCNHWRSWQYYSETVKYEYAFPATQCASFFQYKLGECDGNRKVFYGYSVPNDVRGSYYFVTNSKAPYGNSLGYINWNALNTV
ncbi:lipase member H-B [Diachasma alloeum]|uniref:lipase member H-B n=1 Tax=Diachasma alloeum TaxID=454923 RepID=UPI00073849E4|nr:lipase member H-B [Diachasma alloeum]